MKNNLLAQVLLGLLGVLLLLASIQMLGIGQGINELEADEFDPKLIAQLDTSDAQNQNHSGDPVKQLDQIVALPLFSQTREPYVAPEIDEVDEENEVAEASPLDAKVTSIVITAENSYVMVQDNVSKQRLTLAQGMPLEGEQGLWTVANIEPRKVTFEAEGESPVELELEVFSGSLGKAGGGNKGNKAKNNKNTAKKITQNKGNNNERANSAEAIRKKIAERRAQMRKEAADRNQKQ